MLSPFLAIAANVQGFAPGQNEITNYRTLGSVAANFFQRHTAGGAWRKTPCWQHVAYLIEQPVRHFS